MKILTALLLKFSRWLTLSIFLLLAWLSKNAESESIRKKFQFEKLKFLNKNV